MKSTEMKNMTGSGPMAYGGATVRSVAPITTLGRGVAGNDPVCDGPADSRHEVEALARRASAASRFGDAATVTTLAPEAASSAWPSTYELYQAARANRAFVLGEMVATASRSVRAFVRRTYRRYRKYRQESALYETLSQLDDRTLHDLGFDRSEIRSVAAEWAGEAERTRVRVLHTLPGSSNAGTARNFARAAEAAAAE
jgi:uncharacterized protein YjiS (DUF1127 family)